MSRRKVKSRGRGAREGNSCGLLFLLLIVYLSFHLGKKICNKFISVTPLKKTKTKKKRELFTLASSPPTHSSTLQSSISCHHSNKTALFKPTVYVLSSSYTASEALSTTNHSFFLEILSLLCLYTLLILFPFYFTDCSFLIIFFLISLTCKQLLKAGVPQS